MSAVVKKADVIVVGAGLSGLTAAFHLLQQQQQQTTRSALQVIVLEARHRIGGRIHTVENGLDLGPTWFWSENKQVHEFLQLFQLESFEQYEQGDHIYEVSQNEPIQRFRSSPYEHSTISYRFAGGTISLVKALEHQLPQNTIQLQQVVQTIHVVQSHNDNNNTNKQQSCCKCVQVQLENGSMWEASHVIVTLPPHLAATTITYHPPLPSSLHTTMKSIPTWMGFAKKVALRYPKPFWRDNDSSSLSRQSLSGMAISQCGPVQQFHDATNGNIAGLFGWVMEDSSLWKTTTKKERQQAVVRQAVHMFGPQASEPMSYNEMDWGQEVYTTNVVDNPIRAKGHPYYGHPALQEPWEGCLWWATTEASPVSGGYLDGAIYIGRHVAQAIWDKLQSEIES